MSGIGLAPRLRARLAQAGQASLGDAVRRGLATPGGERTPVDLIINANELTHAHGTGVLMSRVLEEAGAFVLFRAFDSWGGVRGVEPLAEYAFHRYGQDRADIAQFIASRLPPWRVRRILSIPYTREDVVMAIAAKAITGAPMAIWVMDDNSLCNPGVDRGLFAELVRAADARFCITGPMRDLYEQEYGSPFGVLPPLVARRLIREQPSAPPPLNLTGRRRAVMVGNVWHQNWLEEMLDALTGADIQTDWFTSSDDLYFLLLDPRRLRAAGVTIRPGVDHAEIARRTEDAEFVVIASSTMTETDGNAAAIGRLSLPSKMPFVTASAGTPFLVLANGQSGAADYVRRFGLGEVARYDREALSTAADRLASPTVQLKARRAAHQLGSVFDASGAYALISQAAEAGGLIDDRFERLFPRAGSAPPKAPAPPTPAPLTVQLQGRTLSLHMREDDGLDHVAALCRRDGLSEYERPLPRLLAAFAARSDGAFLDVGANTGLYSLLAASANPRAAVHAFEPVPSIAARLEGNLRLNPDLAPHITLERVALSDSTGVATFREHVNDQGLIATTSTLASWAEDGIAYRSYEVRTSTLDDWMATRDAYDISLIKVDIEGHELAFLEGARRTLASYRPFMVVEMLDVLDFPAIRVIEEDLDYLDFALRPHLIERQAGAGFVGDGWNHLLVPRERLNEMLQVAAAIGAPVG